MSLVLIALVLSLAAVAASVAYAVVTGITLFRDARSLFGALGRELDALARSVDNLGAHEPGEQDRLNDSVMRLEHSWARLSVLLTALRRLRRQSSGALALYPRKR